MANIAELSDVTFASEVFRQEGAVLVEFWAPWCRPCLALAPELSNLATEWSGRLKVVRLNVDENPVSSLMYGVKNIPALLVFRSGEELGRIEGYCERGVINEQLTAFLTADEDGSPGCVGGAGTGE